MRLFGCLRIGPIGLIGPITLIIPITPFIALIALITLLSPTPISTTLFLILEEQILCRPQVGVDGLYLRYSPTHVPAKQGKIGPIKSSAVILILEEQILCRPQVGVDGLY